MVFRIVLWTILKNNINNHNMIDNLEKPHNHIVKNNKLIGLMMEHFLTHIRITHIHKVLQISQEMEDLGICEKIAFINSIFF